MPQEEAPVSQEAPQVEAPADSGQAGEIGEAPKQEEEAPPREYIDPSELGGKFAKVKVDGEEIEVPFEEVLNGYSRTEDYTRKTQTLAQQRQEADNAIRLQQAFAADPALTIRVLAQQAGMTVEQFAGLTSAEQKVAVEAGQNEGSDFDDPLEQRLSKMEMEFAQREADARLEASVQQLKQTYQLDHEGTLEVVNRALQLGLGPDRLADVYKMIAFDKMNQARDQVSGEQQSEEAKRQAAAAAASAVVSSGEGSASGVERGVAPRGPMSLRESIEAAWDKVHPG